MQQREDDHEKIHLRQRAVSVVRALVLLAPAWKRWGKATSVKKNCIVIHSPHDEIVPFGDSVELCEASGIELIAAGMDHRLNCEEGRKALERTLASLPQPD